MEADKHNASKLWYFTMNVILNKFDSVSKSEGFGLLLKTWPELAVEIL